MNLATQIEQGESKILELKERLPKNVNIAKTLVAFSNTAGGKLIIGVDDHREVLGINGHTLFEMQDKVASIISDHSSPSILPEIYSVNIEGKLVLVIEIVRSQEDLPIEKTENERKWTITDDYERLTLEKQKILLYLLEHQTINRSTASPLIQAKSSKTSEVLAQLLEEDQLINKKGKGRATYYTLKQNDN